jgi:hypothetical protein
MTNTHLEPGRWDLSGLRAAAYQELYRVSELV